MESIFTNNSRRHFLERIAIASTILVVSPAIVFGKKSSQLLRFAVLGDDSVLAGMINNSDNMTLVDNQILTDVIYVSKTYQKSLNSIQEIRISGKQLIVEGSENDDSWVDYCRKSGSLLTIVERSGDASKLFENANYYEGKTTDFRKVITLISFFERHTKPLNFKIIEPQKPAEMPVS